MSGILCINKRFAAKYSGNIWYIFSGLDNKVIFNLSDLRMTILYANNRIKLAKYDKSYFFLVD